VTSLKEPGWSGSGSLIAAVASSMYDVGLGVGRPGQERSRNRWATSSRVIEPLWSASIRSVTSFVITLNSLHRSCRGASAARHRQSYHRLSNDRSAVLALRTSYDSCFPMPRRTGFQLRRLERTGLLGPCPPGSPPLLPGGADQRDAH